MKEKPTCRTLTGAGADGLPADGGGPLLCRGKIAGVRLGMRDIDEERGKGYLTVQPPSFALSLAGLPECAPSPRHSLTILAQVRPGHLE